MEIWIRHSASRNLRANQGFRRRWMRGARTCRRSLTPSTASLATACNLTRDSRKTRRTILPEVIHAFLVQKFQRYIPNHPAELRVLAPHRNIPQKPIPPDVRVLTPQQWVDLRVAESEELLWRKTCAQCHALRFGANATLPTVAKSNIPKDGSSTQFSITTLTNSSNASNATLTRRKARKHPTYCCRGSNLRKVPSGGREAAESRCFECHTYHDWKNEKPVKGTFTFFRISDR